MLAELLAHALAKAVIENLAPRPTLHLARRDADLAPAQDEHGLPLPMIPGNAATPTTLCAIEASAGVVCGAGGRKGSAPNACAHHHQTCHAVALSGRPARIPPLSPLLPAALFPTGYRQLF